MKKHLLLLLLATACDRAPEKPAAPVHTDPDGASVSSLLETPDGSVMLADGGTTTPPPTAQQREDYRAQMTLAARANNTDSMTVTVRDRNTGQFVQKRVPVQAEEVEEVMEVGVDSAYTVVAEKSRERFMQQVNKRLETGFYLRGPMHTERTGTNSFVYLQDMVRHRYGEAAE